MKSVNKREVSSTYCDNLVSSLELGGFRPWMLGLARMWVAINSAVIIYRAEQIGDNPV